MIKPESFRMFVACQIAQGRLREAASFNKSDAANRAWPWASSPPFFCFTRLVFITISGSSRPVADTER